MRHLGGQHLVQSSDLHLFLTSLFIFGSRVGFVNPVSAERNSSKRMVCTTRRDEKTEWSKQGLVMAAKVVGGDRKFGLARPVHVARIVFFFFEGYVARIVTMLPIAKDGEARRRAASRGPNK